ncbi:MAG: hypothetical protein AAF636_22295 [Pseudomonadota bacterium]
MSGQQETYDFDVTQVFSEDKQIVLMETWQKDGQLSRIDGPAMIDRSATTGGVLTEMWCVDGLEHREDAPALIEYALAPAGAPLLEAYKWRGMLHRRDGPALIERTPQGQITRKEWWIMGARLNKHEGS